MNMKLTLITLVIFIFIASEMHAEEIHSMNLDTSEILSNESDTKSKRRWGRKRGHHGGNAFRAELKQMMKEFMSKVPEGNREEAQKIITYLHTSYRVAKTHVRNNNVEEALAILQKRMRLKTPAFFDQAPPILKYFKLATEAEIAKIHLRTENPQKGTELLESVISKSRQFKDFPKMLLMSFRHDLMKAYKKSGRQDKADKMLTDSLLEAEAGLDFE
jgi:hypothetical protein